jgi:hypothetical protein
VVSVLIVTSSLCEEEGMRRIETPTMVLTLHRYSVLPAISMDGMLAVDITEGSFTAIKFGQFIDGLLSQMNQYPAPNSIIVMDNARIHKNPEILEMILER